MDIDAVPGGEGGRAPLEVELAAIVEALLTDRVGVRDAIGSLEAVYHTASESLRDEAQVQLHRPARYMRLQGMTAEMATQAATWHLVWCLYCNQTGPAGVGGPDAPDAGDVRTFRQLLADKTSGDPTLSRVASVVAWLESLADDALAAQGAPRFADHDGVWIETRQVSRGPGALTELDPDAPGRQGKALHADNAKAEERLLGRLWQLVRAGRVKDARALAAQCGQPWRAASLGGGGPLGPLPVGVAAVRQDDELDEAFASEELAFETVGGCGTQRALWKWACLQAADAAGRGLGGAAGRYEAALYGAMAGSVPAMLPVCATWEDACWAHCRAWLDLSGDAALCAQRAAPNETVGGDVLMGVLQRCGLAGGGRSGMPGGAGAAAVDGALGVALGGHWPSGQGCPLPGTPQSFDAVFDTLASSSEQAVASAARDPLHQVQQLLVTDRLAGLVAHLYRWLVSREGPEPGEPGEGGGGGADERLAGLPPRALRMVAFACHLVLMLEALGAPTPGGGAEGSWEQARGMREQLLVLYLAGLLDGQQVELVPQYLPLLQEPNRQLLAHELLSLLTARLTGDIASSPDGGDEDGGGEGWAEADATCRRVHSAMTAWFQQALVRQSAPPAPMPHGEDEEDEEMVEDGGPSNGLATWVRPDESRILIGTFLEGVRFSASLGPGERARAARWAAYPLQAHATDSIVDGGYGADEDAESAPPEAWALADALHLACALCCEMALGDGATCGSAAHLLEAVLPEALLEVGAAGAAEQLRAAADDAATAAALDDEEGIEEEEGGAADTAVAAAAAADELDALSAELSAWRSYFTLDARLRDWSGRYEAHSSSQQAGPPSRAEGASDEAECARGGRASLVADARALLAAMTTDLLRGSWLAWHASPERALQDEGAAGRIEIELLVTAVPGADGADGIDVEAWEAGRGLYPRLRGATLFDAESQLRAALQGALSAAEADSSGAGCGLALTVAGPPDADGFVSIALTAQPTAEAWSLLVSLAVSLLQGGLPGLSPHLLVNLRAGRASSAAVCRRCCLGQVVLRCASLRQALVDLGCDGSDGQELIELLCGVGGGEGDTGGDLLGVLSQGMLQRVLQMEADTTVAVMQQAQERARATAQAAQAQQQAGGRRR